MIATDPESLRRLRAAQGLTQAQMAAAVNTPVETYENWEQGRRQPPGCLAVALSHVIHCPPEEPS